MPDQKKICEFLTVITSFGGCGLLIIEKESGKEAVLEKAREQLLNNDFKEYSDYVDIMKALSQGEEKVFYVEHTNKLDGFVLEIICEFEAGMVSLADRKYNTGLITAKWPPTQTSFIVIMSRRQVEASYKRLFQYTSLLASLNE